MHWLLLFVIVIFKGESILSLNKWFFKRGTSITAKVVCDSVSEQGVRLTTFEIEYPRIVMSEFNTHRCLVGDTLLSFDLPSGIENGGRKKYNMTMKDFHDKWHTGSKPRKSKPFKTADLSVIKGDEVYTCKQLSQLLNLSVSNLRTLCRKGKLESINSEGKLRSEDYKILGKVFIEYRENQEDNVFSVKNRLKNMKLRFYNTDTGRIENTTITDIWSNGVERVFELKVEGSNLRGTGNHPILTQRGWVQLKDVTLDDFVYTSKKSVSEDNRKDPKRFQNIDGMWRCQWQRDFKRKYVEDFGSVCSSCGVTSELDVHHIIPVYKNPSLAFDETNVVCICKSCHDYAHREQGWQTDNYAELIGVLTKVVSVEDTGEYEEVYDLTVEHEQHNFLANDIVVHNCVSKNSSSSRAIPVSKMLEHTKKVNLKPVYFGSKQSGMQAGDELVGEDLQYAKSTWESALHSMVHSAKILDGCGVAKEVCNRLVEPFQLVKVVCTATDWDNFFNLRLHPDADPNICMLAYKMYKAMEESNPIKLKVGEYHLPYVNVGWNGKGEMCYFDEDFNSVELEQAIRLSAASCASVSYRTEGMTLEKADKIFDMLIKAEVIHASPFEHLATPVKPKYNELGYIRVNCSEPESWEVGVTHTNKQGELCSGNLRGWIQYRHLLPSNTCWEFNFDERMNLFS